MHGLTGGDWKRAVTCGTAPVPTLPLDLGVWPRTDQPCPSGSSHFPAVSTRPLPRWAVIHWDAWTRRHQARARWFHKRARLARDLEISLVS